MSKRQAENAVKALKNALAEYPDMDEVHVTTDEWKDGSHWVGIALTPDEAMTLAEAIWPEE